MTINLHDLTGQESGIILVETDDGRHKNVVVNWGGYDGLPYYLFCFGEKAASSSVLRMNRPACCCSSM